MSLPAPPAVGQVAPGFSLAATDGGLVDLTTHPGPLLLVFLRHLA